VKLTTTYKWLAALFASGLISISLHAQNGSGYFNQAEILFKNREYYEASQVFEKYLATEKNSRPRSTPFAVEKKVKGKANIDPHQEAVYQLAESYRMINDYQKAEKYYKEAVGFSAKAYPDAPYWYAVTLRANGKYNEALKEITTFLEKHTEMDATLVAADREMEDLKFIQQQSERANDQFALKSFKGRDSSSGYALTERSGDTVVYTAIVKEKSLTSDTLYVNSLFESSDTENPLDHAGGLGIQAEKGIHDGMATFSRDGKNVYFTRWSKKNNQTTASIFLSQWNGKKWSKPVKAPDPVNVENSNNAQPCLTRDGRYLIFSSDRAGGAGGYDLWAVSLDSGLQPIQVRNLGNVINSAGDEEAPFLHDKSRTLVFASNGRVGMGGFDLYYAKGSFGLTNWEKPVNPGAPLNSVKDDIYFVSTDEENLWNTGWLSSDRSSECCLALFRVTENNHQLVRGTVTDCKNSQPLANVLITVTDLRHPDRLLGTYRVDSLGRYSIALHNSAHFRIHAALADYQSSSLDFNLPELHREDTIDNENICLRSDKTPPPEVEELLKDLTRSSRVGNFAYKKANLNDSAHDRLDSLAVLMKRYPDMIIQVEGYTDGIGGVKYNLRLARKRVDACIRYLVKQGIQPERLIGKPMGKCCPIAPDTIDGKDNPEGRELNRRVEYKVLKF